MGVLRNWYSSYQYMVRNYPEEPGGIGFVLASHHTAPAELPLAHTEWKRRHVRNR